MTAETKWTKEMDALLGTDFDKEVAKELGVSKCVVRYRRGELGISSFKSIKYQWTPEMEALLGTMSDRVVADRLETSRKVVRSRRHKLSIPAFGPNAGIRWTEEMDALLGTMSDRDLAGHLKLSIPPVACRRWELRIPAFRPRIVWTPEMDALLGMLLDKKVAQKLGLRKGTVKYRRQSLGILSWLSQNPSKKTRAQRERELPRTLTYEQWKHAVEYFGGCCAYCGKKQGMFLTQDHLVPVVKRGGYTQLNIIPVCQVCNNSKRAQQADLWIRRHFGEQEADKIIKRIVTYLTEVQRRAIDDV